MPRSTPEDYVSRIRPIPAGQGILKSAHVIFGSAGTSIFGAPEYAKPLNQVITRYGIDARFKHELVEIRPKESGMRSLSLQGSLAKRS